MSVEFILITIAVVISFKDIYRTSKRIYMQFALSEPRAYLISALIFFLFICLLVPIILAISQLAAILNKAVPEWMATMGFVLLSMAVIYILHSNDIESVAVRLATRILKIPERSNQ